MILVGPIQLRFMIQSLLIIPSLEKTSASSSYLHPLFLPASPVSIPRAMSPFPSLSLEEERLMFALCHILDALCWDLS